MKSLFAPVINTSAYQKQNLTKFTEPNKPYFSWDRVPVSAHCSNRVGNFTASEIQWMKDFGSFITVSNGQGQDTYTYLEDAMNDACIDIKAKVPKSHVLFYWNTLIAFSNYRAYATFNANPSWSLKDASSNEYLIRTRKTFDMSNTSCRNWWLGVLTTAFNAAPYDGFFADALVKSANLSDDLGTTIGTANNLGLRTALDTFKSTYPDKTCIYNGFRGNTNVWSDGGYSWLNSATGSFIEHFTEVSARNANGSLDKDQVAKEIENMDKAGRAGKLVICKGFPSFNTLEENVPVNPLPQAKAELGFPLACFLIGAQKYSYFCYSWGYASDEGQFEYYPEFDRPLGYPLTGMIKNGYQYQRYYQYCDVFVDLAAETYSLNWH